MGQRLTIALVALLLSACGPDFPDQCDMGFDCTFRGEVRVDVADCLNESSESVDFWADLGVDYLTIQVDMPRYDRVSVVPDNTIAIRLGDPGTKDGESLNGRTTITTGSYPYIRAAHVVVKRCNAQTIAHELGHAMGLSHSTKGLMHKYGRSWEVSEAEAQWVSRTRVE